MPETHADGFLVSCQFNIDTACVDVEYEDGFVLSIYTPTVVPSSIMRKFIYKSGRTQSAQGRETCP